MAVKETPLTLRLESALSDPPPKWKFPKEPLPPKKPTIPPKKMPNIPTPEPPLTLRIRELEQEVERYKERYPELERYKERYYTLYELYAEDNSPHVREIEDFITKLDEELIKATSTLLGADTSELFSSALFGYRMELFGQDIEFSIEIKDDSSPSAGFFKDFMESALEQLGTFGEDLFESIMKHENTPAEYAKAKEIIPKASSSKKPNSKSKKASRMYEKSKAREEKEIERTIAMNRHIVHMYELRERLRASPEAQAVIKKIIQKNAPIVFSIFTSPHKTPSVEKRLKECEAQAERYRKALRISVGLNAPVTAGGRRRTVKRRRDRRGL